MAEEEEKVGLGWGWFLGRRSTPQTSPIPKVLSPAKRRQNGLKRSESASQDAAPAPIPHLGAVVRGGRFVNALSGAPDNGLRKPSNLPDYSGLGKGRVSVEDTNTWSEFGIWNQFAKRKDTGRYAMAHSFDLSDFAGMDFDDLAELLSDLSPEVSKAIWDFVNLANSGYECKAYGPDGETIDKKAQAKLDEMMDTLARYHGTAGVFFDRLFKMIFLRGSFLLELVLAENGRDFIDVATPDPKTLEFKRRLDSLRGQIWTFGQRQQGQFVDLNLITVRYIPVHPLPDSIEGHPLCSSAFFLSVFLMSILRDTKRVVQHQGYMRLDVEVEFEKLKETMPTDISGNPEEVTKWMGGVISAVEDVYSSLEPDDTYVHSDSIKINNPVGTVSADSLGAIDALFKALERMSVRALKTMPILMGTDQSRSETQANREWEIYAKGIETCQHWVESAFEYEMELALRAQGIQADVKLRFAQFRAAEKMRDAQVDMLEAQVARARYDNGWISQDEAAQQGANKKVADAPEPRNSIQAIAGLQGNLQTNPNEGEARAQAFIRDILAGKRIPAAPEIVEAEAFVKEYGNEIPLELFNADVADADEQAEVE